MNYFDTMGEAIDFALERHAKDFTLTEDLFGKFDNMYYEQSQTRILTGTNAKGKTKYLNISLYRFNTGRYELVHYIS